MPVLWLNQTALYYVHFRIFLCTLEVESRLAKCK